MTTRRDLVEAQAFHRRRLVAALLSGGRQVEPTQPGRALLGGVVLAVLLVAGACVARAVEGQEGAADGPVQGAFAHPDGGKYGKAHLTH